MKRFMFEGLMVVAVVLAVSCIAVSAQQPAVTSPAPRGVVLEVTYYKDRILAYQRVGEWTWYGYFQRTATAKPRDNELPIEAVKIASRLENGVIKARVTLLRGKNMEVEDFVADHAISPEKKTIVRELSDFGVAPFEIQLVRAPLTVPELPTVVNKTKALQISVEPAQSTIPTFGVRVLNNSPKPVASFSYYTSNDGIRKLSGAPRNEEGGPVIKPGETFVRSFRYAMKTSPVSTGEVPPALPDLVFNVTGVVFMDGTYEGDAFPAAIYLTGIAGQKALLRRFLDLVRSKDFANSPAEIDAAIASVDVDAVHAEFVQKFPTLTPQEKEQLRGMVDFGKGVGEKFFRGLSGEPPVVLAERLKNRIESLP